MADLLPNELGDPVLRHSLINLGTALILGTAAFTLLLWLFQSPTSLNDPFRALAKISAFSAICFLSLNFLLSTRARWLEELFGGLDGMYRAHCTVGRMSLIWMVLHPTALALANVARLDRMREIFLPGVHLGYTLGTAALGLFIILMVITIVYSLPYSTWLNGHRFMGIVLLMATYHALASGSDIKAHPILAAWTVFLASVGMISFLYTLVLYRYIGPRARTIIQDLLIGDGTVDAFLVRPQGFSFRPGQFVYARFVGTDGEYHPYSISGWDDSTIRLSIKSSGDLTSRLQSLLRVGGEVSLLGPYGRFGEKRMEGRGEVWIAGGIGITPFLSLLKAEAMNPSGNDILLIWSYNRHGELPYEEEIIGSIALIPRSNFIHWNSKERGRVNADAIRSLLEGDIRSRRFLICGPRAMMLSLSRQLVQEGVRPVDIVMEDFDLV